MLPKLKVVADAHIWAAETAFSSLPGYDVDLHVLENTQITRAAVHDADILLTRSATRVNADLLQGSSLRFAATATIGDDHYDKAWLEAHGIGWANAAGSSTDSVIEYMITTLLELHVRGLIDIPNTTLGIIGVGRIGSKLADICASIGMRVLRNDPPRARAEGDKSFCRLDEVLEQADLITLHTPLLRQGRDSTVHLLDQAALQRFKGRGVINAGRGSCVDNMALCDWLDAVDSGRFAVLDCWESEPSPLHALMQHAGMAIATPHIAGHSIEGKAANTQFAYNALCQYLHVKPEWDMHDALPAYPAAIDIDAVDDDWQTLHAAATALYPIANDDAAMRAWAALPVDDIGKAFSGYRRQYPARRGWKYAPVHIAGGDAHLLSVAERMGFRMVELENRRKL